MPSGTWFLHVDLPMTSMRSLGQLMVVRPSLRRPSAVISTMGESTDPLHPWLARKSNSSAEFGPHDSCKRCTEVIARHFTVVRNTINPIVSLASCRLASDSQPECESSMESNMPEVSCSDAAIALSHSAWLPAPCRVSSKTQFRHSPCTLLRLPERGSRLGCRLCNPHIRGLDVAAPHTDQREPLMSSAATSPRVPRDASDRVQLRGSRVAH